VTEEDFVSKINEGAIACVNYGSLQLGDEVYKPIKFFCSFCPLVLEQSLRIAVYVTAVYNMKNLPGET